MSHKHYTLIHKRQYSPSKHPLLPEKVVCTSCPSRSAHEESICSNPFAVQILADKSSLSRQAVINSMNRSLRSNKNPKLLQETSEKMAVTAGKKSKGRKRAGRSYDDEMDVYQAKLINWEQEKNFERDDVTFEEYEPTMDEIVHGEYFRSIFPSFRERAEDMALGGVASDQELRDMGLLYDSEDENEHVLEAETSATPVACTPYIAPRTPMSDSDLDDLWELVEGRRLPVEMRGEWDILSEF